MTTIWMNTIEHNKIIDLVKDNLRDVILRPTAYNNKLKKHNDRFTTHFIGVEDCNLFHIITVCKETVSTKEMSKITVDRNYNIIKEQFKSNDLHR